MNKEDVSEAWEQTMDIMFGDGYHYSFMYYFLNHTQEVLIWGEEMNDRYGRYGDGIQKHIR
jgi:hypothetical protein